MSSSSRNSWILAVLSAVLTLAAVEAAARIWVVLRWPPEKAHELTHLTASRGRFHTHPQLPYALTPGFSHRGYRHNGLGFRGPDIPRERTPGIVRIALLGASTVYAIAAENGETAADVLSAELHRRGLRVEVLNAGVPGWTSKETLVSLRERVLPLRPDLVVVMDGRNEAFPQLYRNFAPDYSHYRVPGYEVQQTNARWKRAFRWSHALMVIVSRGEILGFSMRAEHPDYGSIRLENAPNPAEAMSAASEPSRFAPFRANLREIVREARAHGSVPVLAAIPFRPEGWASGVLDGADYVPAVSLAIRSNLAFVRSLARSERLPLVETQDLVRAELMIDDCHFNPAGEAALGRRYADVLEPVLRALAVSQ